MLESIWGHPQSEAPSFPAYWGALGEALGSTHKPEAISPGKYLGGIYESFSLKTTSSHIFKDDFKALDISEDWPK